MITRELKMTVVCKDCQHQFGAWRDRCPACGTSHEVKQQPAFNAPKVVRERRANECIFCRRRGAKKRCPHCNELIHPGCLGLHTEPCARFQVELANVNVKEG